MGQLKEFGSAAAGWSGWQSRGSKKQESKPQVGLLAGNLGCDAGRLADM